MPSESLIDPPPARGSGRLPPALDLGLCAFFERLVEVYGGGKQNAGLAESPRETREQLRAFFALLLEEYGKNINPLSTSVEEGGNQYAELTESTRDMSKQLRAFFELILEEYVENITPLPKPEEVDEKLTANTSRTDRITINQLRIFFKTHDPSPLFSTVTDDNLNEFLAAMTSEEAHELHWVSLKYLEM